MQETKDIAAPSEATQSVIDNILGKLYGRRRSERKNDVIENRVSYAERELKEKYTRKRQSNLPCGITLADKLRIIDKVDQEIAQERLTGQKSARLDCGEDFNGGFKLDPLGPTCHLPGTLEKVDVLHDRAKRKV